VSSDKLFDKMNNSLHFSLVVCTFLIHLHFPELHLPPAASAQTPLLHFTFGLQSELKLHLPQSRAERAKAHKKTITTKKILMIPSRKRFKQLENNKLNQFFIKLSNCYGYL
jgi:hypothetical protein